MAKKRRRRNFTAEQKQAIVNRILKGERLVDVARDQKIQPSQLSQWKRQLTGGGSRRRGRAGRSTGASAAPRASAGKFAGASDLEQLIGQLTVENMRLKREIEELSSR